jgi:hypothetical protein
MVKPNSYHLKAALYSYWRYKKQFIVADEVSINGSIADIIVNTGGFLFEIEIKTSKSDLVQGEKHKHKHDKYLTGMKKYIPNQFYLCVPTDLVEVAKEWVKKTNPNYGILEYRSGYYRKIENHLVTVKKAKFLHQEPIQEWQKKKIIMRLSSACATHAINKIPNEHTIVPIEEEYCI